MFFSSFEIFKIGIGPSSSHTIGPMAAAARFIRLIRDSEAETARLQASLHGSLAFTGRGHATDRAVILGLAGFEPASLDPAEAETALGCIRDRKVIEISGLPPIQFDPEHDLIFDYERQLPGHANGLRLFAIGKDGAVALQETYYSIGGGTVLTEDEIRRGSEQCNSADVPHIFRSAADLIVLAGRHERGIPGKNV